MTRIHFRMLNRSKGAAVWGPRAHCDRTLYPIAVRSVLDGVRGLDLLQEMVAELLLEGGRVAGVVGRSGLTVRAPAVVVTAGTLVLEVRRWRRETAALR